ASASTVAGNGQLTMQEYEALLDPSYAADCQWEREEQRQREEELRAELARVQQVSRGSVQTVRMGEPPLQNSTAIDGGSVRPGLTQHGNNTVYVPPAALADKKQTAVAATGDAMSHSHPQMGPRQRTDLPSAQVPQIDAKIAQSMRKVNVRQFVAATRKWKWWRHDFEVAMLGAGIPQTHWVAVLPTHLDDRARDAYEKLTGAHRGCQTIDWDELAEKFELRFQETINPNNAMLMLKGMKFDRWKDDFSEFSTRFYDMAAKAYHKFDPAAL
ncbi:MAG: hypothetical protein GY832_46610, partial [Chloroflexi bacterium]|nr:hypothetical protein [Chloroflexota bacterium]